MKTSDVGIKEKGVHFLAGSIWTDYTIVSKSDSVLVCFKRSITQNKASATIQPRFSEWITISSLGGPLYEEQ